MRAIIINLTRFGDLLQTQPVISALKSRGYSVDLICLENFAAATNLLRDVQNVYALPGAKILGLLHSSWPQSLNFFNAWQSGIGSLQPEDLVLNLTAGLPGRLLARLLTGPAGLQGFGLDEHGFGFYANNWGAFLQAASAYRGCSPLNLVDIFLRVADLHEDIQLNLAEPEPEQENWARQALNIEGAQGFIGFQLGASAAARRWPVGYFVHLSGMLWNKYGLCPVLLGTKSEQHLAQKYISQTSSPYLNFCGQTSLPQLAALLSQLKMLVTNDTGTMHLAAGLGVQILSFFLCTAQPWDTGPYLAGSVCLEPDLPCHPCSFKNTCQYDFACRKKIRPEFVAAGVDNFLTSHKWKFPEHGPARVWISYKEQQFMNLKSLSGHEQSNRVCWIYWQRFLYRHFLDENLDVLPTYHGPIPKRDFAGQLKSELQDSKAMLSLMQTQLELAKVNPKISPKLMANWQRIQKHWEQSRYFGVLGLLWMFQTQQAGDNLSGLSRVVAAYSRLVQSCLNILS